LLTSLGLRQPANGTAYSAKEAEEIARRIGYPVVIRPSYVLGGRAMEIVHDAAGLNRYIRHAVSVSGTSPVLIDRYLQNAIEVDVDALSDGERVEVAGIMEHIEEAGIHSGDSACSLPPYSLDRATIDQIERQTVALARALGVIGLMNVQFAVQDGTIFVLEVNPRASRTVPFVAKATGVPIAKIAARAMLGESLADCWGHDARKRLRDSGHVAVKESVFPFARFPGVDPILSPEMKSTGEVMGLDTDFGRAFAKSQLGAGISLPLQGSVFVSVRDQDKEPLIEPCRRLVEMGFALVATKGTAVTLAAAGLPVTHVNKVREGRPHIVDRMLSGRVQLVFNTTEGSQAIADSFSLRRTALTHGIPYYTTVAGARAAVQAITALRAGSLEVAPLQSYL
jgi:carbamoyl-phosphate synthase large subunit